MSAMPIPSTMGVAVRSPRLSNSFSVSDWSLFDMSPNVATSGAP